MHGGDRLDRRRAIAENERRFGAEARKRYGDAAVDAANERALSLSEDEWTEACALESAIVSKLREAMEAGDVEGPLAQELCRAHARWVELTWGEGAYSREAYAGLARLYVADERFRAHYDGRAGAGATDFLSAALLHHLA